MDKPEIVADEVPVFFTMTDIVLLEPTVTLPKLAVVGVKESVPEAVAVCPVARKKNASARNIAYANLDGVLRFAVGLTPPIPEKTGEYRFFTSEAGSP
jgi:hypothetical protein